MRSVFRERLDEFSHTLVQMCGLVGEIMAEACDGLHRGSLNSAENALSRAGDLTELRDNCNQRAVELLALEGPLARDLRQVVSSIYIVDDFDRMGTLAMHIATAARRRHPEKAVPAELSGYFEELGRLTRDFSAEICDLLVAPDADAARRLSRADDAVDDIDAHLMVLLTQREWRHSTREAVDTAMLSRFFERYADHCVAVSNRIVYLATGSRPVAYQDKPVHEDTPEALQHRYDQLTHRFHRDSHR